MFKDDEKLDEIISNNNLIKMSKIYKSVLIFTSYLIFSVQLMFSVLLDSNIFFVSVILKYICITRYLMEMSIIDNGLRHIIKKIFLIKILLIFVGYIIYLVYDVIDISHNYVKYFDKNILFVMLGIDCGWIIISYLNYLIVNNFLKEYKGVYCLTNSFTNRSNRISNVPRSINEWNLNFTIFEILEMMFIILINFVVPYIQQKFLFDIIFSTTLLIITVIHNWYLIKYFYD